MSHTLTISDDAFDKLTALADKQGQTPETLIETWVGQYVEGVSPAAALGHDPHANPHYESFEEFFTGLGMSQEDIRAAQAAAETDGADV